MKKLNHWSVLNSCSQQFLVLRIVLLLLDFGSVMKSLEKISVGCCRLLGCFPELFLSWVAVHRADLEQTIAELLRRSVEIASLRTNYGSVIDETKIFMISFYLSEALSVLTLMSTGSPKQCLQQREIQCRQHVAGSCSPSDFRPFSRWIVELTRHKYFRSFCYRVEFFTTSGNK